MRPRIPALPGSCIMALLAILASSSAARAAGPPLEVLWWTYAHPESGYRVGIERLAANAALLPDTGGLDWNLTWFEPGSPVPDFTAYDVLVIEGGEAFRTGPVGGPLATPDYSGILANRAAIQAARGDRTFISGADADFHAVRGDTGNIPDGQGGICSPAMTAPQCWDGAAGHLANAVNWAASGEGLGIVSLVAGEFAGSEWWLEPESFLREELDGYFTLFGAGNHENVVVIPPSATALPLNSGLTDQGLSDWDQSFHAGFFPDIPGYAPIVAATAHAGMAVAIASADTAGGATLPPDAPDLDADGRTDAADNCIGRANGPLIRDAGGHSQLDTNGDGYGNRCDADLDGSNSVNATDLALFRLAFGSNPTSPNWNPDADFNGSGAVNAADLAILRTLFGLPPGPSGTQP